MPKLETRRAKLGFLLAALALAVMPAEAQRGKKPAQGRQPVSAPQPAGPQLWLTHGEATTLQGEPAVRFAVYHSHGLAWCSGYLYFTKARVGYEVTNGPRDYSKDSFLHERGSLALPMLPEARYEEFKVKIQAGREYKLRMVRDPMDPWGSSLEGVSIKPLQEAWENFDLALEHARAPYEANRPSPPIPEPVKTATLSIEARPGGAEFYLDDQFKGTTSSEGRLAVADVPPGEHRLRLSKKEYEEWNRTLTLEAGENRTIEVELAPAKPPEPAKPEIEPLSVEGVMKLLEAGVTPVRLSAIVQERGVSFTLTPAIESRLRALGATDALLLEIAKAKK